MKKFILLFFGIASIYFSCKKEKGRVDPDIPPPPPVHKLININDPDAVSAALKIFHGERINGSLPAKPSSSPVLDPATNGRQFYAVAGGYVAIKPRVLSGTANGYYFKVKGASSYFKVDYSKPRGERRLTAGASRKKSFHELGPDNARLGDADSLIILKIPDSLQTGTFCGNYYLRDDSDQISDSIEVCVTITNQGPNASGSSFIGTWKFSAEKSDSLDWDRDLYDTVKYQGGSLYCTGDTLSTTCTTGNCPEIVTPSFISVMLLEDFVYHSDGTFVENYARVEGLFNAHLSTCSKLAYDTTAINSTQPGIWSWEETTGTLIMLYDFDFNGKKEAFSREFKILENTGTHLLVSYTMAFGDHFLIEMDKR